MKDRGWDFDAERLLEPAEREALRFGSFGGLQAFARAFPYAPLAPVGLFAAAILGTSVVSHSLDLDARSAAFFAAMGACAAGGCFVTALRRARVDRAVAAFGHEIGGTVVTDQVEVVSDWLARFWPWPSPALAMHTGGIRWCTSGARGGVHVLVAVYRLFGFRSTPSLARVDVFVSAPHRSSRRPRFEVVQPLAVAIGFDALDVGGGIHFVRRRTDARALSLESLRQLLALAHAELT